MFGTESWFKKNGEKPEEISETEDPILEMPPDDPIIDEDPPADLPANMVEGGGDPIIDEDPPMKKE